MKIAIDPGHGMSNRQKNVFDTGATHTEGGVKFTEAAIALKYGLSLKDRFRALGHDVFMTRDDDADPTPVGARAGNAETAGCDVFLSLHLNDADDDAARGLEVLYRGDDDKPLAAALQDALIKVTGFRDRGIKLRPDLAVLKFNGRAVLIELGFIAHDRDRDALLNPAMREAICQSIAATTIAQFGGSISSDPVSGGGPLPTARVSPPAGDTLTVRNGPALNSKKVGELTGGTLVTIHASSGIWRRIAADAARWVSSLFLTPVTAGDGGGPTSQIELVTNKYAVDIFQVHGKPGLFFRGRMSVDADGAPKCYHPDDTSGLDALANSTSDSRKFIQGTTGVGPARGFFVSMTALNSGAENRCDSYADAVTIPYMVFYSKFPGVSVGDLAMIINLENGKRTHAIIADTNPNTTGEASVRSAEVLGIRSSPRNGGTNERKLCYLIFPGTRFPPVQPAPHWPDSKIREIAEERFAAWGGMDQVKAIYPDAVTG